MKMDGNQEIGNWFHVAYNDKHKSYLLLSYQFLNYIHIEFSAIKESVTPTLQTIPAAVSISNSSDIITSLERVTTIVDLLIFGKYTPRGP